MKKTLLILGSACMLLACTKANDVNEPATGVEAAFLAETEELSEPTKTLYLNSQIKWKANDAISILYQNEEGAVANDKFTTKDDEKVSASFSGSLTSQIAAGASYCAIYPHANGNTIEDGKLVFNTSNSTNQQLSAGYSFASASNHTFAVADEHGNFQFKVAQSLLKFQVPDALKNGGSKPLKSITVSPTKEGQSLLGKYACSLDAEGKPVVEFTPETTNTSILVTNTATSGWKAQPYYIAVPPATIEGGITVRVDYEDGSHYTVYNFSDLTFERKMFHSIGTLKTTADLLAVDLDVTEVPAFFTSKNDCSMDEGMLKVDKTSNTGTTTGFFTIDTKKALGQTAYDASAFNTVRFKIKYKPEMEITSGDHKVRVCMQVSGGTRVLASRVNGKKQDGEEYVVKTDGSWNIVELDIKEMNSGYSTINNKQITICPFGGDLDPSFNSNGTNRVCWIKDFEFVKR